MKWFNNLKVAVKVFISCFMFIILIIILAVSGLNSITESDEAFNTFYEDRFVPVRELNKMFKNILQIRINMIQEELAFKEKRFDDMEKRFENSKKLSEQNNKIWEVYMNTKLTKEEAKLADDFIKSEHKMAGFRKDFGSALKSGKEELARGHGEKWLANYNDLKKTMDSIMQLQQDIGLELKNNQGENAASARVLTIILLAISIAMGIIITFILARSVSNPAQKGLEFANSLADGDLTKRIDLDQKDELGQLGNALNKAADNLENLISNVIMASQNLAQAVQQIATGNQNLSQRTSEQASSLEEVASTIEEATSAINQNADNAQQANGQAKNSSKLATDGGELVNDAVSSINDINQTSKQIGEIISVINEIAFQTNLLALNAAVEAARAGEQGRGFAVVAGEVRNLAQRSGNAAKEIGDLIKDSIDKIEIGTEKANKSGESLTEIINSIENVSKLIAEIAAASNEQKQGIEQINVAIGEMDTMTQQNSALVEETASASEEMSNQASELLAMVQKFKIKEDFKQQSSSYYQKKQVHISDTQHEPVQKKATTTTAVKTEQPHPAVTKDKKDIKTVMSEEGFEEF